MSRWGWNFRRQSMIMFAIILLDGALLGAAGGMAGAWRLRAGKSGIEGGPAAASVHDSISRSPAEGGPGSLPAADSPGGPPAADSPDAQNVQDLRQDSPPDHSIRQIALTFDDGPHETYTPRLLDGLKERGVRATFFLMGENLEGKEDLVRRMQAEGHLIGNHSYSHIQLTHAGEDAVCEAIERTETMIEAITGVRPEYLRPPYGDWNESLECRMDLTTVFWSVDSLDWKLRSTEKIVKRVRSQVGDGDIILMHDIFPTSVEAALELVDRLQEEGYHFVTADELVID